MSLDRSDKWVWVGFYNLKIIGFLMGTPYKILPEHSISIHFSKDTENEARKSKVYIQTGDFSGQTSLNSSVLYDSLSVLWVEHP